VGYPTWTKDEIEIVDFAWNGSGNINFFDSITGAGTGTNHLLANGDHVRFNVGRKDSNFNAFGGDIGEILIYDEYLPNNVRRSIRGYLDVKWALP